MKQYYVILNEDMKHFGMEYHLGLNEDVKPFEPDTECGGGLFFADKENVLDYLAYNQGTKLAVVEVPEDEQIVNLGNIYKAHRIIIKEIQELWIPENYKWLKSIFVDDNIIFQKACKCGALNFAKWLYVNFKNLDIHENNELAFRYACSNGHLETAKWLYSFGNIEIQLYRNELLDYSPRHVLNWLKTL